MDQRNAVTEKSRPELVRAMDEHDKELVGADELLKTLASRLAPVLADEKPAACGPNATRDEPVKHWHRIAAMTETVKGMCSTMRDLLDRLEV